MIATDASCSLRVGARKISACARIRSNQRSRNDTVVDEQGILRKYLKQNTAPWVSQNTFNTLRPRQNGRHFADDISKCIFINENVSFPIEISLKFTEGSN